jgi:hypothetical protein
MTVFSLSPQEAGNRARLCRDLVRRGELHRDCAVLLDRLIFDERKAGADRVQVSITALQTALHIRRERIKELTDALSAAGLLRVIKDWVYVLWQGIWVKRQATNVYVFDTTPEFPVGTVSKYSKKVRVFLRARTRLSTDLSTDPSTIPPRQQAARQETTPARAVMPWDAGVGVRLC